MVIVKDSICIIMYIWCAAISVQKSFHLSYLILIFPTVLEILIETRMTPSIKAKLIKPDGKTNFFLLKKQNDILNLSKILFRFKASLIFKTDFYVNASLINSA